MLRKLLLVLMMVALSGCAEVELASHVAKNVIDTQPAAGVAGGNFKVGKPYTVMGQTYHPQETYNYTETGIASWYGPGFHGKKTASGERFDTAELTAAHRTLQMPSLVRVTNLDNGRSVIVRVNDRGPFARGRVIDVSQRAAELLEFKNRGTAKVKLELLPAESMQVADLARRGQSTKGIEIAANQGGLATAYQERVSAMPVSVTSESLPPVPVHRAADGRVLPDPVVTQVAVRPSSIYVQAGAFTVYDNAERLRQSLDMVGQATIQNAYVNGQQFFRVRVGPAPTVESADHLLSQVVAMGHNKAIIIVD